MRRSILFSTALMAVLISAGTAAAGDRYGPPEPVKPVNVSAVEWNGPLLAWTNKSVPTVAPSKSQSTVAPFNTPQSAPAQPAALPASIYAPPAPAPAATVASAYAQAHPTGEVLTLSLADLPPAGPSLERQQAAEEDAAVLAAQVARANALAAKDIAAGKPVTGGGVTDLLGGP